MSYAKDRKEAFALIDEMRKEGATKKQILITLHHAYGYTEVFYNKYMGLFGNEEDNNNKC